MPIYEYETIPQTEGAPTTRYEIRQCMSENTLTHHPETGEPIRRVYGSISICGSSKGEGHHHGHDHDHGHGHHHQGGGCCCGGACEH